MRLSAYSVLSTIEAWITGYKSEHLQLGLQQGICQAIALMPVLINQFFVAVDRGGSALFIAVTVRGAWRRRPVATRRLRPLKLLARPATSRALLLQVAVVLEPSTGDAFRKLMLRLMAAGVSGGISLLVLYIGALPASLPSGCLPPLLLHASDLPSRIAGRCKKPPGACPLLPLR